MSSTSFDNSSLIIKQKRNTGILYGMSFSHKKLRVSFLKIVSLTYQQMYYWYWELKIQLLYKKYLMQGRMRSNMKNMNLPLENIQENPMKTARNFTEFILYLEIEAAITCLKVEAADSVV